MINYVHFDHQFILKNFFFNKTNWCISCSYCYFSKWPLCTSGFWLAQDI